MKKTLTLFLISGLIAIARLKAQSIQDGINNLYADRFQTAVDIFQKLLAVNPNNTEATYWLGQTYLDMDDNDAARQLYDKALMASANAPLLLVGKGHIDLLDKKTDDARQKFESALTMTRTKKGDDPVILNAIGRANVDAKNGDLAYAIDKLKAAADKDPKNPDIFLNLGNAYRKAKPGEAGDAYTNYKKALDINPNFAYAYVRIARIFETQKNWELVLDNLNQAISKDPKFTPAYERLFEHYFWDEPNFSEAEKYLNKYIESKLPEKDINDDYMYAQLCYLKKDYDCVISKDLHVAEVMGAKTKPKVYKGLAYSYLEKGDTANAKKYVDAYFAKEKPEDIIPGDYVLKANAYSGSGSNLDMVIQAYMDASKTDTTITGKVDWLKKLADLLKTKGERRREVDVRGMIFTIKPIPTNLDIFNWGLAAYFAGNFSLSDSVFKIYSEKYPDQTFGWLWDGRSLSRIDTTMELGLAVPPYQKLLEIADKDRSKYKSEFMEAAGYLTGYSNNILKSRDSALMYVNMILEVDSTNQNWKDIRDQLLKLSAPKQNTNQKSSTTSKPTGLLNKKKIIDMNKKDLT